MPCYPSRIPRSLTGCYGRNGTKFEPLSAYCGTWTLLAVCKACQGHLPFFPLASGLLTGKYRRGAAVPAGTRVEKWAMAERVLTDANFDILERLEAWAQERNHTLLELAFACLLATPEVASVIAGATSPDQIRTNAAAGTWELTSDEADEVRRLVS